MQAETRAERVELVSAIVLAIATILTAWSAFEATKWSGVMSIEFSDANATRTESLQASTSAGQLTLVDVTLFTDWLQAVASEQLELQQFIEDRFRDEFKPAFEEWLASDPLVNPDAAAVPFALRSYQLADERRSERLAAEADDHSEQARRANQRGDNYVLTTVLFAAVLFFAGVSTKFSGIRARTLAVVFAVVLLLTGIGILATFPIEI